MYSFVSAQTLEKLKVSGTIGDHNAKHLADAIQNKRVTRIVSPYFQISYFLFTQTLTTLELCSNHLGPIGTQYLADALCHNKVSLSIP